MDKAKLHIAARARKNIEDIMFKPEAGWVMGYGLLQAMPETPIENLAHLSKPESVLYYPMQTVGLSVGLKCQLKSV